MRNMCHSTYNPMPARVIFGINSICGLADEAARLGHSRSVIICSPGRAELAESVARDLGTQRALVCTAARAGFPQYAFDQVMSSIQGSRANGIIAVGGGTAIGLGKAVVADTDLPMIAVPTTFSGSELAANWYVGTDSARRVSVDPGALAKTVFYDPALLASLPAETAAASGMNAMAHAVESLYGSDTNPVVQVMAKEAIHLLATSLPEITDNPGDLAAWAAALRGAWFAAGFRARGGLEHVMAQRIRDAFDLDHARTHAVMLPYVTAFNAPAAPDPLARVARTLGVSDPADGLHALNRRLGLATGLSALGMPASGTDEAVRRIAAADIVAPRSADTCQIRHIIEAAFAGAPPSVSGLAANVAGRDGQMQ